MKKDNAKKIFGAILSSVVVLIVYIGIMGTSIYFSIMDKSTPKTFVIVISIVLLIICTCMIINLINRIKEIKGGEEDEASKY